MNTSEMRMTVTINEAHHDKFVDLMDQFLLELTALCVVVSWRYTA